MANCWTIKENLLVGPRMVFIYFKGIVPLSSLPYIELMANLYSSNGKAEK